jgi:hypothetical protein
MTASAVLLLGLPDVADVRLSLGGRLVGSHVEVSPIPQRCSSGVTVSGWRRFDS